MNGEITWDQNKPDGTPRKLMDSSKLQRLRVVANDRFKNWNCKSLQQLP